MDELDDSRDAPGVHGVDYPRRASSPGQFEILLSFMEKHGDLGRPEEYVGVQRRIRNLQLWEELEKRLNAEPGGTFKTLLKWKKAWTDLKNNTKRKANRLQQGVGRCNTKLTPFEVRLLKLIGKQKQQQKGVLLRLGTESHPDSSSNVSMTPPITFESHERLEQFHTPPDRSDAACAGQLQPKQEYFETDFEVIEELEDHDEEPLAHEELQNEHVSALPLPTLPDDEHDTIRGASASRVPLLRSHRTLGRAAQRFFKSDAKWKRYKMETRRREMSLERARLALRAKELKLQKGWQDICNRGLGLLERCLETTVSSQVRRRSDSVEVEVMDEVASE